MYNHMYTNALHQQEQQRPVQQYKIAARKRILIVNHEDDVNFSLKLVMEEDGGQVRDKGNYFQVDYFNDPILALSSFEEGSYDLLLIAVVMPKMNGFELAREIRRIDDNVKICFIIAGEIPSKVRLDASSSGQEQERYQDRFIKLPIENKDLIEQIDRIIRL
jgi:CheY-like chemotaxis protein